MKKILLQGAMDIEVNVFVAKVKESTDYEVIEENGMVFHTGTIGENFYIVNQTGMGTIKAAMTTTYAIGRFQPTMVINQGTAGAQQKELSVGDLILVEEAVNINALSMPKKKLGEGSNPFSWEGFHTAYYGADKMLLDLFSEFSYTSGCVKKGKCATGDIFSREDDRIIWLANKFDTQCEDMETAAVYEVCQRFRIPCVGLRIISNNELKDDTFNEDTAEILQNSIWKNLIENI